LVRDLGVTAVVVSHDWDLVSRFGLRRIEAIAAASPDGVVTRIST